MTTPTPRPVTTAPRNFVTTSDEQADRTAEDLYRARVISSHFAARDGGPTVAPPPGALDVRGLSAFYGGQAPAVADVSLTFLPNTVTSLIGPSGCGKSTLLRCLNGMHLTTSGARIAGDVVLDGVNLYSAGVDLVDVRQRVGMVFQRPNPFPTMSIADNVTAGLRLGRGRRGRASNFDEVVERSLRQAGLWEEVKDRLKSPGGGLSGGQQQRLCIARALAVSPQILLMDEPCSALDPISTLAIEDTMTQLKNDLTIIIVTHNIQQAGRVSDVTAFMNIREAGQPGRLVEVGPTESMFSNPHEKATEDYITGRFG
jgi:phosphate transport system ATP-binding protein